MLCVNKIGDLPRESCNCRSNLPIQCFGVSSSMFPLIFSSSHPRKSLARTCLKKRSDCSRAWTHCRSSVGARFRCCSRVSRLCMLFLNRVCSILHSVVLNLIIESGVNWNRDERMFALFMMDPKVCDWAFVLHNCVFQTFFVTKLPFQDLAAAPASTST
jgi:hypothetical protein